MVKKYKPSKYDKKQDKRLKRIERNFLPELKHGITTEGTNTGYYVQFSNALITGSLTGINQGDDVSNRTGDSILVKKIKFKLIANCKAGATSNFNWIRALIIQDNIYNGIAPTAAELLSAWSVTDGNNLNAIAPINYDFFDRKGEKKGKRLLMDKLIRFGENTTTATQAVVDKSMGTMTYSKTFKKPLQVNYQTNNEKAGRITLCLFPGNDTTLGSNPEFTWISQVEFYDA